MIYFITITIPRLTSIFACYMNVCLCYLEIAIVLDSKQHVLGNSQLFLSHVVLMLQTMVGCVNSGCTSVLAPYKLEIVVLRGVTTDGDPAWEIKELTRRRGLEIFNIDGDAS